MVCVMLCFQINHQFFCNFGVIYWKNIQEKKVMCENLLRLPGYIFINRLPKNLSETMLLRNFPDVFCLHGFFKRNFLKTNHSFAYWKAQNYLKIASKAATESESDKRWSNCLHAATLVFGRSEAPQKILSTDIESFPPIFFSSLNILWHTVTSPCSFTIEKKEVTLHLIIR